MTPSDAIAHLTNLAEGWECAAEAEDGVMLGLQKYMDAFNAARDVATDSPPDVLRRVRAYLDARDNARNFRKDAEAARLVLSDFRKTLDAIGEKLTESWEPANKRIIAALDIIEPKQAAING